MLLKKIIEADRAKETTLFYSTNGQQIGKHYEKLWSEFKRVEIFFSIDGIERGTAPVHSLAPCLPATSHPWPIALPQAIYVCI